MSNQPNGDLPQIWQGEDDANGAQAIKGLGPSATAGDIEELLAHRLAFDPLTLEQVAANFVHAKRKSAHLCAIMNHSGVSLELNRELTEWDDEVKSLAQLGKALHEADELKAAIIWGVGIAGGRPLPSREQLDYYADVCGVEHARVLRAVAMEAG